MLGKLYKYEFRRIGKVACLLLAVFLGVTVVGSIYLVSPLFHSIIDSGKGYNRTLTLVSGILGIFGLCYPIDRA